MAVCARRTRPSSHGPPPKPPMTGMETARTTAGPATGPECLKSRTEAPASSNRFASSTSLSAASFSPWNSAKRSEEHTSELQSRLHLVCRLLLEKKKKMRQRAYARIDPDNLQEVQQRT